MEDWQAEINNKIAEQKVQESIAYEHKLKQQRDADKASLRRSASSSSRSHGSGWLLLAIIGGLVVVTLLRSGAMLAERLSATEIIDQYGWSQYLANLAHSDEPELPGLLVVEQQPLACYADKLDGDAREASAPELTLAKGQGFLYWGWDASDASDAETWVAVEVREGDEPRRCFALLPEERGEDPLERTSASALVDPLDLIPLLRAQHQAFWARVKQEPGLVVVGPHERRKRRVYRNKEAFADVTRLVSAPKGTSRPSKKTPRARRRRLAPHYYFLPKDRLPWLQKLRETYLGEAKIQSLAARLAPVSPG